MTPAWKEGQTVVSRLRVHARGLDPLSTRLRVESILGAARLHPAGLAPSALLIIRRFRDPLPGAFSLRRGPLRPPPAWERAAEEAIRDLARRAIRPALESNEVDTEAVLFADRAEFLACLARDWLDNRLESHWWWRSVSRATDPSRSVSDSWSSSPEFIPGALQHLAVRGRAASFVRAIPGDVARDLTCAMARAHGLDSVHSSISVRPETSGTASETRSEPLPEVRPPAPWVERVPEASDQSLGIEQRTLLGLGLILRRAPALARSSSFALDLRAWRHSEIVRAGASAPDPRSSSAGKPSRPVSSPPERTIVAFSADEGWDPKPPEIQAEDATPSAASADHQEGVLAPGHGTRPAGEMTMPGPDARNASRDADPSTETPADVATEGSGRYDSDQPSSPPRLASKVRRHVERDALDVASTKITTCFGGVFYLLNVLLHLEIYGDFTSPQDPGIGLSPWDFLALLGRALLGREIEDDPIWPLLATLSGRGDDEPPGSGFDPPPDWRVSPRWLSTFPVGGTWTWETARNRLLVRHPGGFLILDVPRGPGDVEGQLTEEVAPYRQFADFDLAMGKVEGLEDDTSTLDRWIGRFLGYARHRIAVALGLDEPDRLASRLCRHQARVYTTSTHLDVVLSLVTLPIEIRRAGLDRNPGWIPASGRIVAFHFE